MIRWNATNFLKAYASRDALSNIGFPIVVTNKVYHVRKTSFSSPDARLHLQNLLTDF